MAMNLYFDTEFTSLCKNTTLISIGVVDDFGNKFYAEFTDYDESLVDDWIQENVINNLYGHNDIDLFDIRKTDSTINERIIGNVFDVGLALNTWIEKVNKNNEQIKFISDVCHYDMVLLIDLLAGNAMKLDKNIIPFCYDINQMFLDSGEYISINEMDMFNLNREFLMVQLLLMWLDYIELNDKDKATFNVRINDFTKEIIKSYKRNVKTAAYTELCEFLKILRDKPKKHNSLFDSFVIKYIYQLSEIFNIVNIAILNKEINITYEEALNDLCRMLNI